MTVQLNLLPDVKKEFLRSQKTKAMVISGSIVVTIVAVSLSVLLLIYVLVGQQLQISLIGNDIKSKSAELNNIQDISKYLTIQNQLMALPSLHNSKGIYTRLFTILPAVNPSAPNNVKFNSFRLAAAEKTLTFSGNTASFESLNVFVDTLNNTNVSFKSKGSSTSVTFEKAFDNVSVQNSGLTKINNQSQVSFTINVVYKSSVFDAANSEVTVNVPNMQTTPSVVGSPKLFDNQGGQ